MNITLAALLTILLGFALQQQAEINRHQAAVAAAEEQIDSANAYIEEYSAGGAEPLTAQQTHICDDPRGCWAWRMEDGNPPRKLYSRFRKGAYVSNEHGWNLVGRGWRRITAPELAMAGMDNPPPSPGIGAVPCMTFLCGPHGTVHTFSIGAKPIWMTPAQWNDYWQDAYVNYLNEGGHAEAAEPIYSPDCS